MSSDTCLLEEQQGGCSDLWKSHSGVMESRVVRLTVGEGEEAGLQNSCFSEGGAWESSVLLGGAGADGANARGRVAERSTGSEDWSVPGPRILPCHAAASVYGEHAACRS